jgi:hypothetical protein
MRRRLLPIVALALLSGCPAAGGPGAPPTPSARVDSVFVFVPAAPLRPMSNNPGDLGLLMQVFFSTSDKPRGVAVSGTLEVLIFPGAVSQMEVLQKKPAHVETLANPELRAAEAISKSFGVCYFLQVPLGSELLGEKRISVVGRYTPPSGPPVLSDPTTVPLKPG